MDLVDCSAFAHLYFCFSAVIVSFFVPGCISVDIFYVWNLLPKFIESLNVLQLFNTILNYVSDLYFVLVTIFVTLSCYTTALWGQIVGWS